MQSDSLPRRLSSPPRKRRETLSFDLSRRSRGGLEDPMKPRRAREPNEAAAYFFSAALAFF
jgi:hypothetical protein